MEELRIVDAFDQEIKEELAQIADKLVPQDIPHIHNLANAIIIKDYFSRHNSDMGWKDEIKEELESAEEKYNEYLQSNDPTMLEFARQELNHASHYISKAKTSTDMKLREKVPEYEKTYNELAGKINSRHGSEKIGRL